MRYSCRDCSFKWEGTSYTFEKVREHEKTHVEKNIIGQGNKKMSIRCKVCNTSKVTRDQIKSNYTWECKTCCNILDAQGHVIIS